MFQSITPQPFFPTIAWVHDLEPSLAARLNEQLARDLDRMTAPRPQLTSGMTWQTDQILHEIEAFAEFTALVETAASGVMEKMEIECDGPVITGCWANINPPGAPHNPHTHPNNLLSGVYYVQASDGADSICFHDPRPQVDIISPKYRKLNQFNSMVQTLPIKPGRLVIFPAWMVHSVVANRSQALRISVSFNVMPKNYVESFSRPKWEGIPLDPNRGS